MFCLRRGLDGSFDSVYLLDHDGRAASLSGCEDEWKEFSGAR